MNSIELACGHVLIPFIFNGSENGELSQLHRQSAVRSLEKMQEQRSRHRLGQNYSYEQLHLDKMFIYNVLYDFKADMPVLVSGVQIAGRVSARVFSRYFVFEEYRTLPETAGLLEKSDDFEMLSWDLRATESRYPFLFMSRERGGRFFEKIKMSRPEIFSGWTVHPVKVEVLYPGNFQSVFYLNRSQYPPEVLLKELSSYKT